MKILFLSLRAEDDHNVIIGLSSKVIVTVGGKEVEATLEVDRDNLPASVREKTFNLQIPGKKPGPRNNEARVLAEIANGEPQPGENHVRLDLGNSGGVGATLTLPDPNADYAFEMEVPRFPPQV